MKPFKEFSKLPKIFLDLDGVLVDFVGGTTNYLDKKRIAPFNSNENTDTQRWKVLSTVKDFWQNLPVLQDGIKLFGYVKKFRPSILSAYAGSKEKAIQGKSEWLVEHVGLEYIDSIHVVKRSEKKTFATGYNLLIDDQSRNIEEWERAGGIGILYKNSEQAIELLKTLGF